MIFGRYDFKLKKYKHTGYFVYVNHTQVFADTFIPSNPIWPKKNDIIVMEVSVQQSINIKDFHPHIALMTN